MERMNKNLNTDLKKFLWNHQNIYAASPNWLLKC